MTKGKNQDHKDQKGELVDRMAEEIPASSDQSKSGKYEVGYGKPPKQSRFAKGKSGNPRGRPRKQKPRQPRLSDAPSDGFLSEEAYRTVTLRENGETIELPLIQAVMRSLGMSAVKGNRLSQKYFLELVEQKEELHAQLMANRYMHLESLKRKGQEVLIEHQRKGLPIPHLLPHPDDIILNSDTLEAYVNGPESPEQEREYEFSVELRDHLILRSVCAEKTGTRPTIECDDNTVCRHMVFAHVLDRFLPRRYRWQDNAEFWLVMKLQGLSRRECKQRVTSEFARLQRARPEPKLLTPELRQYIDQFV